MADSQRKTENLFTGVIEQGTITGQGVDSPATNRIRTAGFTSLTAGIYTLSFTTTDTSVVFIFKYDNNDNFIEKIPNDWASIPYTFTLDTACKIRFAIKHPTETTISPQDVSDIILNVGSTALPYWQHSLRKLTTATEAVENPLYSDGTAITAYTLKGNTVQNGTPTPSNPVDAVGVGERTENLFNAIWESGSLGASGGNFADANAIRTKSPISCEAEKTYTFVPDIDGYDSIWVNYYGTTNSRERIDTSGGTFTTPQGCEQVRFRATKTDIGVEPVQQYNVMFNEGTAKPYEPYGYKIPISNGQQTTNIYLGSTVCNRAVKKATFSGGDSEGWYLQSINNYGIANFALNSAISPLKWIDTQRLLWVCNRFLPQSSLIADTNTEGIMLNQYNVCFVRINSSTVSKTADFKTWLKNNPIVVYYVLLTPETAAVNEPLMKIGDYADTLSNAASIPTIEGANSITVDTTVQPSEFTATWTGWHNASVQEWNGSAWS